MIMYSYAAVADLYDDHIVVNVKTLQTCYILLKGAWYKSGTIRIARVSPKIDDLFTFISFVGSRQNHLDLGRQVA